MASFVSLSSVIILFIAVGGNRLQLGDIGLSWLDASRYGCNLAVVGPNTPSLDNAVRLCNQQTYDSQNKECFVADCQIISNGEVSVDAPCPTTDTVRHPFIYNADACSFPSSAFGFGGPMDMSLLPKEEDIGKDELVCMDYQYYMAICILLMIAFATFLCFITIALNKLKQLRERSYW